MKKNFGLLALMLVFAFLTACDSYPERLDSIVRRVEVPNVSCILTLNPTISVSGLEEKDLGNSREITISLEKNENDWYFLFIEDGESFFNWSASLIGDFESISERAEYVWHVESDEITTIQPYAFEDVDAVTNRGYMLSVFSFDDSLHSTFQWLGANRHYSKYHNSEVEPLLSEEEYHANICEYLIEMYGNPVFKVIHPHVANTKSGRVYFYEGFGGSVVNWSLPFDAYEQMIFENISLGYGNYSEEIQKISDPIFIIDNDLVSVVSYDVDPTDMQYNKGISRLIVHALSLNANLYSSEVPLSQWTPGFQAYAEAESVDASVSAEISHTSTPTGVFYMPAP